MEEQERPPSDGDTDRQTPAQDGADEQLYVVGVGASAGGLEALETLFGAMPLDSGMAFIVLQHLSPDFESHMDELLGRKTDIPIRRIRNGMRVRPNEIYLAPAKQEMIISNGTLLLTERDPTQGFTLPIDHFFRALAHDAGTNAIGIVLSGTGSDGSRGIREIHAAGGLVLSQSEESAKFDGMPRSAQKTGVVDAVLHPELMPERLMLHAARDPSQPLSSVVLPGPEQTGIDMILRLLRDEYGIDFAYYKPNTVARRVERRISMASSVDIADYVEHLRSNPEELSALYQDLLIGVTRFFRDPDAFAILEERLLPHLLDTTPAGEELRLWVPGCATGEEAYTLAILLHEQLTARERPLAVKIFGTDIHPGSLEAAAIGRYPEQALSGMSEERRQRYFRPDGEQHGEAYFRIAKELRQLIVFARHNVMRDPPFTRLHLISCRNVLIYLQAAAQKKTLSLFHFGLRTDGILFLGPSETPGYFADEYEVLDKRWKIFRKRRDIRLPLEPNLPTPVSSRTERPNSPPTPSLANPTLDRRLIEIYDRVLAKHMPPSLLVDEHYHLVHAFGGVERILRVPAGRASVNVLDLMPQSLRTPLSGALQHAGKERAPIRYVGLRADLGTGEESVRLVVEPLYNERAKTMNFLISVTRHETLPEPESEADDTQIDLDQVTQERIRTLEGELRLSRENLQATIEELETSNEELQASNEELVASNEELQSTNEELHSVNEELYTVNAEHQKHIVEITEINNDLDNLLHSIEVGVVFLDAELRIRKFTSAIAAAFHLLPQDIGRQFDNFAHNIEYPALMRDITAVRAGETTIEREVVNRSGDFFFLRILPYRSDNTITGVVLTLIDIDALKRSEANVRQLSDIVTSSTDAITAADMQGRLTAWNEGAQQLYGYTADEALGMHLNTMILPEYQSENRSFVERVSRGEQIADVETVRLRKDGHKVEISISLSPLRDVHGDIVGVSSIARDISRRKRAERQVRRAIEQRDHFLATLSHELRNPLMGLLTATHILRDEDMQPAAHRRALDLIERQSQQMARLLDDLLDVSRMRRDRIEMDKALIDMRKAVRPALEAVSGRAQDAGVTLAAEMPEEPVWVYADRTRLQQVAANLLANAIKYTPTGKRIWVSIVPQDDVALLEVRDEGVGIATELQESIFEPFMQSEEPPRGWEGGMGLGLALVRSIALAHEGSLEVSSEGRDRGSTFTFRIPISDTAPEELPQSDTGEILKQRVLLIDDEEDNCMLLAEALRCGGFDVVAATTGTDGAQMALDNPPDVAVVDIGLPDISGYEVARRIRRSAAGSPYLIALTGFGQQRDREAAREAGFDEHLVKPITAALLRRVINHRPR
ncbi:chemotaxis protein CheB [Haliangium ochraceum]|uniref:histidine kinase n=1 Tax=Haliangium ochraceum (strain DSM 14365 / JCM 11303 / SMP-2) TaxID=502025 RepID=D0LTQ8_HALO1|nr:chemotaxis protein CheB [Haliangium ochraceum]ACY15752.1 signal transduction histidine kinase with CheB and CheR activity [Haliangium ochraceum DSM 14365]